MGKTHYKRKSLSLGSMADSIKIGMTGLPGSGKTETLIRIIDMLEEQEMLVGGMLTEPIMKGSQRVGCSVINWQTKEKGILAHKDNETEKLVGEYYLDLDVLENIGVSAINQATDDADVIDEVGRMEVESFNFIHAVKEAMDSEKPILLTLHKKSRNPLLQDIRRRDDIRILEVTPINRNLLPYKVVRLMLGEIL